jgi:hypothetical protein
VCIWFIIVPNRVYYCDTHLAAEGDAVGRGQRRRRGLTLSCIGLCIREIGGQDFLPVGITYRISHISRRR